MPQARGQLADLLKMGGQFWRMGISETRKLKALKEENGRLKRLLADAMLDNVALKALLSNSGGARRASGGCSASAFPRDERTAGMTGSGRRPDERKLSGDAGVGCGAARAAEGAGGRAAPFRLPAAARAPRGPRREPQARSAALSRGEADHAPAWRPQAHHGNAAANRHPVAGRPALEPELRL